MSIWTCDYKQCDEIAQWYRKWKGELFKFCTKHEAYFAKKHWGRHVDESELNKDDIRYLERKEHRKEFAKKNPFEVLVFQQKDGAMKIRIKDRRTDERRSFVLENAEYGRFDETYIELERKRIPPQLSIDEYVKRLRNGLFSGKE